MQIDGSGAASPRLDDPPSALMRRWVHTDRLTKSYTHFPGAVLVHMDLQGLRNVSLHWRVCSIVDMLFSLHVSYPDKLTSSKSSSSPASSLPLDGTDIHLPKALALPEPEVVDDDISIVAG